MDLRTWLLDEVDTHRFQFALTSGTVPMERWHERPRPGDNSVAWLVWHMARWQDLTLQMTIRDVEPLYEQTWHAKLGVGPDPGTGFTDEDVDALSVKVDVEALDLYRVAVQDETVTWLNAISDDEFETLLDEVVDTDARWDARPGILNERAAWVRDFRRGSTGARALRWSVVGHTYWHLGELQSVTSALGYAVE